MVWDYSHAVQNSAFLAKQDNYLKKAFPNANDSVVMTHLQGQRGTTPCVQIEAGQSKTYMHVNIPQGGEFLLPSP